MSKENPTLEFICFGCGKTVPSNKMKGEMKEPYCSKCYNAKIVKKRKAPKYKTLGEARISDNWGLDYTIKLKARPKRAGGNMLCFSSSGGRWFFFIPTEMWGDMVKESNKLIKGARAP